jgi:hypothetical protein
MGEVIDPRVWYSAAQAADLLGVTAATVRTWLGAGTLAGKSNGRGRSWSVSGASLLALQRASVRVLAPTTPLAVPVPDALPDRRKPKAAHGSKGARQEPEGK